MNFLAPSTINGMSGENIRAKLAIVENEIFGREIASANDELDRQDLINVYFRLADGDRDFIGQYAPANMNVGGPMRPDDSQEHMLSTTGFDNMESFFEAAERQADEMLANKAATDNASTAANDESAEGFCEDEDDAPASSEDEQKAEDSSLLQHGTPDDENNDIEVNHHDVELVDADNEVFNEMMAVINESTERIAYYQVTFPMQHIGNGVFRFANGVELPFDAEGAGYMSERLPQTRYARWTAAWRDEDYAWMAEQTERNIKRLDGEYIAATFDGKIQGVMSNYKPVSHTVILRNIIDTGNQQHVESYYLNDKELGVYIRIMSADNEDVVVGLKVLNGHSGHSALRHRMYVRSGAYQASHQIVASRNRHLSTVQDGVEAIENAFEAIEEIRVVDKLDNWEVNSAIDYISRELKNTSARQQELLLIASNDPDVATALDMVAVFGSYAQTRGYKTGASKMIDLLVKKALENK